MKQLLGRKPIAALLGKLEGGDIPRLKPVLGAWDLTAIGIGCTLGTGIFVLTGVAAIKYAGPGIMLSFVLSGLACIFSALCYAEFASRVPLAGSAYTYGYVALGEIFAWVIGWDLVLEYGVASSAVAIGWSGYFANLLSKFGISLPTWLTTIRDVAHPDGIMNLPAGIIVVAITLLLIRGIRESASVNSFIVVIKVAIAVLFIAVGVFFVVPANWMPFIPDFVARPSTVIPDIMETPLISYLFGIVQQEGFGGFAGVSTAAALVFFAYIGFDAVSTTAEEARNPKRDLPIGIITSLVVCTILYIGMSAVFTGIVHCDGKLQLADLGEYAAAPMAYALNQTGVDWVKKYASGLLSIGAILGITSVLMVTLLGQSRIFFAMSRDKMLPPAVCKLHSRFQTPYIVNSITCVIVAAAAMFTPIEIIAELANIGTLFAFVIVCAGVIMLRILDKKDPSRVSSVKTFRTPWFPLLPLLGMLGSLYLMAFLPLRTWLRFIAWLIVGFSIYMSYSYFASDLNEMKGRRKRVAQGICCGILGLVYPCGYTWLQKLYSSLVGEQVAGVMIVLGGLVFSYAALKIGLAKDPHSGGEGRLSKSVMTLGVFGLLSALVVVAVVWIA